MDGQRFDHITRALASGRSRRSLLKGLLGLGGAVVSTTAIDQPTDARTSRTRPTIPPPPPVTTTPAPCPPGSSLCAGSCCVDGQCTDGTCCRPGTLPCMGGCCDAAQLCCERDGCCSGACSAGGRCCTSGNTICGEECCPPGDQCCDGECCPGVCYGEELCCPRPHIFNETAWVCCPQNTRPCGALCIPETSCCSDDECGDLVADCHLGRCSAPGGSCYLDPLPDRTDWETGVSVCLRGEVCTLNQCGCGFAFDDGCEGTITCCGCDGETGCSDNADCCSEVCVNGTCLAEPGSVGASCDDDGDCLSGRCASSLCCQPKTCAPEVACGTGISDGCGRTIDCPLCLGGTCTDDSACYSGACSPDHVCIPPVPTGGKCDSRNDCLSPSAICEAGFCAETIGGLCQTAADCSGELMCDTSGTCRVETGGACILDTDCRAGQDCRSDGVCAGSLGQTCVFLDECSDGLTCSCLDIVTDICQSPCTPHNYCNDPGTCKVPPNGACTDTIQCATFYSCSPTSQTCVFLPQPLNGDCFDNTYCQTGLVCICPSGPGTCDPALGVCRATASGACTADADCVAGLVCNPTNPANGPAGFCQLPLGTTCDGSLTAPNLALQCETGACGPTFFRPAEENPVCCLPEGSTCSSDEECCKLPNPSPIGPEYSWTRCRSNGTCGRASFFAGSPCVTSQDCAPAQICATNSSGTLVCQAPPTPIGPGGECDPTGVNSSKICRSGLICIDCTAEVGGYRCADADQPCCRNGQQDDFWCGQIGHPDGGFASNLCCGNTCYSYDDDQNCGACGVDCTLPSNSVCAVADAPGTCGFFDGEDVTCEYPNLCANGYGGDTSLTFCSPYESPPSPLLYFCQFFQGTNPTYACDGGGCACYVPPVVGRDPSRICIAPPTRPCYAGKTCEVDAECGTGVSQGTCTFPCEPPNNPYCGLTSNKGCFCP